MFVNLFYVLLRENDVDIDRIKNCAHASIQPSEAL
jgi:hypothetical protein